MSKEMIITTSQTTEEGRKAFWEICKLFLEEYLNIRWNRKKNI